MMVDVTQHSEAQEKLQLFLDLMEDNEDVTQVYHNAMLRNDDEEQDENELEGDDNDESLS